MVINAALEYLMTLPDAERGTGRRGTRPELYLGRPRALLAALGNPQDSFRSVLIAGTKGKGSTAAMLETILRASGSKTGLYTSPHLTDYRERIQVGREWIDEADFEGGVAILRAAVERIEARVPELGRFTTFEVMTALAFWYFAEHRVEIAVVEVGMGGRWDATNVLNAELSLITPISYDHMATLGNTLTEIAEVKAGIIKEGRPVLSAPQSAEAQTVLERVAAERRARLGVGERDWIWLGDHQNFLVAASAEPRLWDARWAYQGLHVPLLGPHQLTNAGLAVAATRVMGVEDEGVMAEGLRQTRWGGRAEILREANESSPWVIADGAHNGASAEALMAALKFHFAYERLWVIFGSLADKDAEAVLKPFVGEVAGFWTVPLDHPRAASAERLTDLCARVGISATTARSVATAFEEAMRVAGGQDIVLFTGSLAIVREAYYAVSAGQGVPSMEMSSQ